MTGHGNIDNLRSVEVVADSVLKNGVNQSTGGGD
jgi:hypothetical protein